ncbi:MAG: GNAT family N-acetyltransferase [Lachnospiraceae bacterium]
MEIQLRRATMADAGLLFDWANDKTVRQNSFHTAPIPYDHHMAWLKSKLSTKDCRIYIAEASGVPVGQIRVDVEEGNGKIGYSIDAKYRGEGYGKQMLNKLEENLAQDHTVSAIHRLVAQVKQGNEASKRAFIHLGYHEVAKPQTNYIELEKEYLPCYISE